MARIFKICCKEETLQFPEIWRMVSILHANRLISGDEKSVSGNTGLFHIWPTFVSYLTFHWVNWLVSDLSSWFALPVWQQGVLSMSCTGRGGEVFTATKETSCRGSRGWKLSSEMVEERMSATFPLVWFYLHSLPFGLRLPLRMARAKIFSFLYHEHLLIGNCFNALKSSLTRRKGNIKINCIKRTISAWWYTNMIIPIPHL